MGRLRDELIRSAILLAIAVVLVVGFWVHRQFYQFGFFPLLVAGGFATFFVMAALRFALRGEFHGRARGALTFTLDEGERFLRRRATLAILPPDAEIPPVGSVTTAKFETGPEFARFRLIDAYRKLLGDLDDDEVRRAGFRTLEDLRQAWSARGVWAPEAIVLVAQLEVVGRGTA